MASPFLLGEKNKDVISHLYSLTFLCKPCDYKKGREEEDDMKAIANFKKYFASATAQLVVAVGDMTVYDETLEFDGMLSICEPVQAILENALPAKFKDVEVSLTQGFITLSTRVSTVEVVYSQELAEDVLDSLDSLVEPLTTREVDKYLRMIIGCSRVLKEGIEKELEDLEAAVSIDFEI